MTRRNTAVALAARAHLRGGAHSGGAEAERLLRGAAAAIGESRPDALLGPSSLTPDGTLLLALREPAAILDAILTVADEVRPHAVTFCAAVATGPEAAGAPGGAVESAVLAAGEAASAALAGLEDTDVRERRIALLAPGPAPLLATLIDLILVAYDEMTDRQRQIISLTRCSETQQQVARHLDISRQAVNQSLASAGWPHIRSAEETLRAHFASGSRGDA